MDGSDRPADRQPRSPDRRCVGAAMLLLVVVAVLCIPGVLGRNLSGAAGPAVHVDPRPTVGDCLAPLTTPDQLNSIVDLVPAVPCAQAHSAEVLAVGTLDPMLFTGRPTVADPHFTNGAMSQRCDSLAGRFLGWGSRPALPRISVPFFTKLTVPGDLEWQLGQRWYSCELLPGVLDFPISYHGTARNASTGTPPGAFGNCSDGPGELAVSCDRPHHAEQLTSSVGQSSASASTCLILAARIIGTPDPTFGGRLAVLGRDRGSGSACWVTTTSSRSLTATLINHGAGPLPLG